jgi:hypothetical protein
MIILKDSPFGESLKFCCHPGQAKRDPGSRIMDSGFPVSRAARLVESGMT